MDNTALNAAAAVSGLLGLTIQIAQVTHQYTSGISSLPRTVSCYIEELVYLKKMLVDVQDALLFGPESIGTDGMHLLHSRTKDFNAEMTQLCEKLQAAQGPVASQVLKKFLWPFRDDETARWTESLTRCRHHIQEVVVISGLKIQLTMLEEVRMARYRQEVQEREMLRIDILDWICDRGTQRKHAELINSHHPGTGQWVFERPEFQKWTAMEKAILWCYGNPGVGKTQIMSLIAEQLRRDYHVAFFYCSHQESSSQTEATIAASLLGQLVEQEGILPPTLDDLHRRSGHGREALGFDDAARLMLELCAKTRRHVCILLDALDECHPAPRRRKIVSLLDKLGAAGAKILITSRPHVATAKRWSTDLIKLELESDVEDIRAYTEHMIDQSDELSFLLCENLRKEAVQNVVEQTNRMFLLAVFQCHHLSSLTRRCEAVKALKSLPSGLDMAYEDSLSRIMQQSPERRSVAMATLSWLYHAERPLTVSELLQALAIHIDPTARRLRDEDAFSPNIVIDVCAGLVVVDSQRDVVRFAHYSVYEYFHQERTYRLWFPSVRQDIARAVLAFLALEDLSCSDWANVDALLSSYPFLKYAAQCWGHHVREGYHEALDGLAYNLLHDQSRVELVARLIDVHGEPWRCLGQPGAMYPSASLGVLLMARFGALEILEMLVGQQGHSLMCQDASGRTALHWAARGGFHRVVGFILRQGGEDVDAATADGRTALHWAAKHGHVRVVSELIRAGADPTRSTTDGRTALHWAASRGHRSVVEVLLTDGRVDATCRSVNAWTALHWAACSGNRTVVIRGVDFDEEADDEPVANMIEIDQSLVTEDQRPLTRPGEATGHEETTLLLLEAGLSPDSPTKSGRTAMHWAAASGNVSMIRLLKDRGAALASADVNGKLPWQFAAEYGAKPAVIALVAPVG
ncbi:Fc.00g032630.m01.CDS01 [Cosmosporella sp. VM-42]